MRKRVLVVDDEPAIRRLIQVNLERAGYLVDQANDGRQALARIGECRPDIIVSDVMMPYMDGFALVQAVRADAYLRDIPVVMLTAKASDADVFQGYVRGADVYLTKPFAPRDLLAFLQRICDDLERPSGGKVYDLGGGAS